MLIYTIFCSQFFYCCFATFLFFKTKKALDDSDWYIFQDAASMDLVASTLVDFFSV